MDLHDAVRADVLRDLEREPMGVYEVWYAANTLFPDHPVSERLEAAERVIAGLIRDDLVTLWGGHRISQHADRIPVADTEVEQILRSWATWCPDGATAVVWMVLRSGDSTSS